MLFLTPTTQVLGVFLATFTLFSSTQATFNWTDLPTTMVVGQQYTISWTGAEGAVTVYLKKDATQSSARYYAYGADTDTSFNYTLPTALVPNFETERTYIFSAWDSGSPTPTVSYDSPPIFVSVNEPVPAASDSGANSVRRREAGSWYL